ncbi:hypothetical protein, partial [Candidatus Kuenenia stuttgartiensis]|uniref:hypothetical protein n=1 Tax=Kuenenia stuttgartiensis TaxID=174633 RepID=UPI001B8A8D62
LQAMLRKLTPDSLREMDLRHKPINLCEPWKELYGIFSLMRLFLRQAGSTAKDLENLNMGGHDVISVGLRDQ